MRREYAPTRSPTSFSQDGGIWNGSLARTANSSWALDLRPAAASFLASFSAFLEKTTYQLTSRDPWRFRQGAGHAFLDGLAHAGSGEQMQRFLDGLPILCRQENRIVALASDEDRLMGICRLINESVQIGSGFAHSECGHAWSPTKRCRTHARTPRRSPLGGSRSKAKSPARHRLSKLGDDDCVFQGKRGYIPLSLRVPRLRVSATWR